MLRLDKFYELLKEVLEELRIIRRLLEEQQDTYTITLDEESWRRWFGDD